MNRGKSWRRTWSCSRMSWRARKCWPASGRSAARRSWTVSDTKCVRRHCGRPSSVDGVTKACPRKSGVFGVPVGIEGCFTHSARCLPSSNRSPARVGRQWDRGNRVHWSTADLLHRRTTMLTALATLGVGAGLLAQSMPGLLWLAIVFFIIAIVAYVLGARGVAGMSAGIGRTLLFVFLVLAIIFVIVSFVG